jgi:EAL domain-containing protein (putative c-di-GMP-specific phosphodiesterase class I)/CheY-like chemotaxis protein
MAGPSRRLLFVTDDREMAELCASVAEPFGFIVRRSGTREAMEEALSGFGPDAVLLDPEADEGRALAAIARIPETGAAFMLVGPPEARSVRAARSLAVELGLNVAGLLSLPLLEEGVETALRALGEDGPGYGPADIAEAVMRGEITAWYQPQVRRTDNGWKIDGAEALARWEHPDHGLVLPDAFIPTAEAEGQIAAITDCVLRTAIEQTGAWRASGLELRVCAKLTPELIRDPDFPERLHMLVREYDVPPAALVIQVPESGLPSAGSGFRAMLARLRLTGFGLALEHFGAGVSSISDLYQTPFSELKIDGRIIARLPHDEDALRLARGMIALSREIGLSVTGESVENQEALEVLHSAGCERAQGYVISRPLPARAFQALAADWNTRGAS